MIQKRNGGVWLVRRVVPKALREQVGGAYENKHQVYRSTGTSHYGTALARLSDIWAELTLEFEIAAARGSAPPETLENVLRAISLWRADQVHAAHDSTCAPSFELQDGVVPRAVWNAVDAHHRELTSKTYSFSSLSQPRPATIGRTEREIAETFFRLHPDESRDLDMPASTAIVLGRLQVVERDADAWTNVPGFDGRFDDELAGYLVFPIAPSLRAKSRPHFAAALREVIQHRELARMRAAALLRAIEASDAAANAISVDRPSSSYTPREDDKTVSELISDYRKWRDLRHGSADTTKKYAHIFEVLQEVLGTDTPIRSITKAECRRLMDVVKCIPRHMRKRFGPISIMDGVELAESEGDEVELLSSTTVNTYLSGLKAVFNWAIDQEWLEKNPASGLIDDRPGGPGREPFTKAQLETLFDALSTERANNSWKFWVPAVALWSGCRLNEICQARTDDILQEGGIHYLSVSVYDAKGNRDLAKRLKTGPSERNVPLHADLIAAGFLDHVAARRKSGHERLFELAPGPHGRFSHDASKYLGALLDRIGLDHKSLTVHGFRHGFRDECDTVGVPDPLMRALGGWAQREVADKYGSRNRLPILAREVAKLRFDGFTLGAPATA